MSIFARFLCMHLQVTVEDRTGLEGDYTSLPPPGIFRHARPLASIRYELCATNSKFRKRRRLGDSVFKGLGCPALE
jgi:hypothetical protein